jgi:hypothetical protein
MSSTIYDSSAPSCNSGSAPININANIVASSRTRIGVYVERPWDGDGWLIRTHNREHAWIFGNFASAMDEARSLAGGFGTVAISSAGVVSC